MEEITHTPTQPSPANSTTTEVSFNEQKASDEQIVPGQLVEQAMSEHPESLCSNVRTFDISKIYSKIKLTKFKIYQP